MIFWDTSAWLRRFSPDDPFQNRVESLYEQSGRPFGSELLPLEALSAASRNLKLRRGGLLPIIEAVHAELDKFELVTVAESMEEAERLILRHRLRAADALTLSGALVACRRFRRMPFATADHEQATAARREGLKVIRCG
jgi:hypothetical protein